MNNISYSKFISGLNKAGVLVNRKMLSEIAIDNPQAFTELVNVANKGLAGEKFEAKASKKEEVIKEEKATAKKTTKTTTKKETTKKATKTTTTK